jgi:hypothetical protein
MGIPITLAGRPSSTYRLRRSRACLDTLISQKFVPTVSYLSSTLFQPYTNNNENDYHYLT